MMHVLRLKNLLFIGLCGLLAVSLSSCGNNEGITKVSFKAPSTSPVPQKISSQALLPNGLPDNRLVCWGVNVVGDNLPSDSRTCGPKTGFFAGFVGSGQQIDFFLPRGQDRTVELFIFIPGEGTTSCPQWTENATASESRFFNFLYKVGGQENVSMNDPETRITIQASFPGLENNVVKEMGLDTLCPFQFPGKVMAQTYSNGDVVNGGQGSTVPEKFIPDSSKPYLENLIKLDLSQSSSALHGGFASSAVARFKGSDFTLPPYLSSLTRKPDGFGYFWGLRADGQIMRFDPTTGLTQIPLAPVGCPFTQCTVPVWMESISGGWGKSLFMKDHQGQIYTYDESGSLVKTSDQVQPYVSHVSYY